MKCDKCNGSGWYPWGLTDSPEQDPCEACYGTGEVSPMTPDPTTQPATERPPMSERQQVCPDCGYMHSETAVCKCSRLMPPHVPMSDELLKDLESQVLFSRIHAPPSNLARCLDEIAHLRKLIALEAKDWADTDTYIRERARPILGDAAVDGTSECVPGVEDVVDAVIEKMGEQCGQLAVAKKIADRLSLVYGMNAVKVAELCDEHLDRSGNLLGWLRTYKRLNHHDAAKLSQSKGGA